MNMRKKYQALPGSSKQQALSSRDEGKPDETLPMIPNKQPLTPQQQVLLEAGTAIVIKKKNGKENKKCESLMPSVKESLDIGSASLFLTVYAMVAQTKTIEHAVFDLEIITFFVKTEQICCCQVFCRILNFLLPFRTCGCVISCEKQSVRIEQRTVSINLENQSVNELQFNGADANVEKHVVLQRAQSRIGYSDYDNKWSNSQDFVRWCCTDHFDNPEQTRPADEGRPAYEAIQSDETRLTDEARQLADEAGCCCECDWGKVWNGFFSCTATKIRTSARCIAWIIGMLAPPALADKCLIPLLFHTAEGQPNWEVCFDVKNERCTCSMERLFSFYIVLFGILGSRLCIWLATLVCRCAGYKRVCCSNNTYKRLVWDLADILLDHTVAILLVLFELWLEKFDFSSSSIEDRMAKLSFTLALSAIAFVMQALLPEWILCCIRCDWGQATRSHSVVPSKPVLPQSAAKRTTHPSNAVEKV